MTYRPLTQFLSYGPRLDYNPLIKITSDTSAYAPPPANIDPSLRQQREETTNSPTPSTSATHGPPPAHTNPNARQILVQTTTTAIPSTSATTATAAQYCQLSYISADERERLAAKLQNKCRDEECKERTSTYCFPRCLLTESQEPQFYCLNGHENRNCFLSIHGPKQPNGCLPARCAQGYCAICIFKQTRYSCTKCGERVCFPSSQNLDACFYAPRHTENCS